ncbi:MAG: 1,4-dihydroxy-2-naphthoate octaprenyltransferase, partial [Bdellovibrionales bacterium]|nr:1,4-dihydroxy-2-naphthoate octaprenyltransferase [Bdellovibrionales bacterium]
LVWCLSISFKPIFVGVGPVFIGISLSFSGWDHFSWLLNGSILFCIFCIQTATHFFNDAFDFLKGADNISRKGPKRAIQKGWLTPSQLFKGGVFCLFLATLVGGYLVWQGGWPVFCIGVVSLALAYFYTGGSYSLAYTGLADIFVLLFFGLLPVAAVFYLNTGYWDEGSIVAGLQCGFLALSLLVVNNLRDEEEDRKAKKKTLVVRWGRKFGIWEWTLAHYLPYLLTSYWFFKSVGRMAFLPFVLFPFSIYLHSLLYKAFKKENIYSRVFAFTLLHYLLFVSLLSFCFVF